ncbi:ATP synthase F1 subunit gamma [Aerococcaceae bacterium NML191292]|nr:ATP synthase F1 subunit gamma [Aerococcaceae bacterium NML191292]MCW6666630.1 ATP synthase F1 subunit gamma [Aerococcaceae bacterium NML190938]MCW6676783.1 ATP synthase F1 subunit gamma [Aerococcaceae bacterium NML180378]MDO4775674.1 ATP synthase F1 subunit gamma [Aerococcaceae bacterium]
MSLNELKKRIESTKKTAQITNAMQMVSAAKYNKMAQDARTYFEYAKKVKRMVSHVAKTQLEMLDDGVPIQDDGIHYIDFHDMLIERPIKRTGYLIISSDKGLAGGYNTSVIKATEAMLQQDHQTKDEAVIFAIGEPIAKYCREEGYEVVYEMHDISDRPTFEEVQAIVKKAVDLFKQQVFDALYVCYNHHISAISSQFRADQVLPVTDLEWEEADEEMAVSDYLIEPSQTELLDVLLPQYAESQIFGAIIDAKTAEHASRMNAMRAATDNAKELIEQMKQKYNQQRQLKVTNEILEIINGANALN